MESAKIIERKCLYCSGSKDCPVCNGKGFTNHFLIKGHEICSRCIGGTLPKRLNVENGELQMFDTSIKDCSNCNGTGMIAIDIGKFGMFATDHDV